MKIFTQTYDLAKASPHRFWVAPFSEFKIGIKILEKDEISAKDFTLKAGSTEFTPDEDKIDNFTLFTIKSNDTGFVDYTIEVEGVAEKLKLMQIVTDSTVFEIDASGGDVPADVATQTWVNSQISDFVEEDALTAYYTKSETSSATEIGTALEGKQPAGNYLTAETDPTFHNWLSGEEFGIGYHAYAGSRAISMGYATRAEGQYSIAIGGPNCQVASTGTGAIQLGEGHNSTANTFQVFNYPMLLSDGKIPNERLNLTSYYQKNETSSATELADAFAGAGGGAISAYDMSESPVWSKTQVAQAVENSTILPQTIAKYTNNSVSAFNIVGEMNGSNWGEGDNSKKVVVGSQVTSIGDRCFKNSTTKYVVIPDSVTTISNRFMGIDKTYGNDSKVEVLDFGNTRTTVPNVSIGAYEQTYFLKAGKNAIAYVPDALYNTWITKSVWNECVSQIRKHSDLVAPSKVSNAPVNYAPPAVKISPVYEYEWETLSASAPQHPDTLYVVVPDNGFRPYTQVKYSDNTLSSYDISGIVNNWNPTNKAEATDIVFGTKVTGIAGSPTCNGCNKLSSLQFPWTVTTIQNETFRNMGALSSLTIPGTVKTIGSYAFTSCSSLNDITFEGRTMAEVQAIAGYPWDWPTGRTIHCIDGDIVL